MSHSVTYALTGTQPPPPSVSLPLSKKASGFGPLFEIVSARLCMSPAPMVAASAAGLTPTMGGSNPVPSNGTVARGKIGSLLAIVRVPSANPATVGLKVTFTPRLSPMFRLNPPGSTLKSPFPLSMALTTRTSVPSFETVSVSLRERPR